MKLGFLGLSLPYAWDAPHKSPTYLQHVPTSVRWLFSILEIRAFDARRPYLWIGDQGYLPDGVPADRMGGYFFLYVLLTLLVFGTLVPRSRSREARIGGWFFLVLTLVTSALPQSHMLRYYLYWMIVLSTLTWYLLIRAQGQAWLRVTPAHWGGVCTVVLALVIGLTRGVYFRPISEDNFADTIGFVDPAVRAAIQDGRELCIVGNSSSFYLYADTFHAPLSYAIKAANDEQECGSRVVVRAR